LTRRPYNFSAGPAALPEPVLAQAAAEMLDWHGSGMSVMEMSHRGKHFGEIHTQAMADLRALLHVPDDFEILFMQGGGLAENAIVPLNLGRGGVMDFAVTGGWSQKSFHEAAHYGKARCVADTSTEGFTHIPAPSSWSLSAEAAYVHICSNETIHGVEFHELPDLRVLGCQAPLVADISSHMLSRPIDWSRVGLAFGGAQKNVGPAGLTLVFVRKDLLGHALPICPDAFNYATVAKHQSMFNTPPTYSIYIAGLVFQWLKAQREAGPAGELAGLAAIERRNIRKAELLYHAIDSSTLYANRVEAACRSRMNIPFFLRDDSLNERFLAGAADAGLLQLKGHKSVGGMRASLYNAMPMSGVQALVAYMREFERRA
jgi:phosphoserine aminotransferase